MSSTNRSDTIETNFELSEAFSEAVGPMSGIFEATYYTDSNALDYTSDTEENWIRRANRNTRRAARINRAEANDSDSDGEPVAQEREPTTVADLRRQIRREAEQGEVPEADRAIFEEYFGDRYRRPTSPTGRGWQNTARIAAGARITNEIYGPSRHALRNTSLLEPALVPGPPVTGLCALDRARRERLRTEAGRNEYFRTCNRMMRVYNRQRAAQLELERRADECEDALRAHRRLSDLAVMRTELNARAVAFKEDDPAGFDKWADHITVAHGCSTSKSRQHQIIQWYTRGVPGYVLRQVRRVEVYYTTEAYLKVRLQLAQARYGAVEGPSMVYLQENDDLWAGSTWAGNIERVFFGYDPVNTLNGFQAYMPKGEGTAAMLKHFSSNFAARKVRLEHASAQHFPFLVAMMKNFVHSALKVLSAPEHLHQTKPARDALVEYLHYQVQYQPVGETSSWPDARGAASNDGSEVAPIVSEMVAAVNAAERIETLRMEERVRAQHALQGALDDDEGGAGGVAPRDGEDDDLGSASMDEGSSP
jgi:hypothetical protein